MDVPLFFLVSGFLGYTPIIDIKINLWKKVRYILLPFVCAIVFTSIYRGVSVIDIIFLMDKGGNWFLLALFIIFLIYYTINKCFKKAAFWIPVTITIELLLLAASKFLPEEIDNCICFSYLCCYFPCFIFGVLIKRYGLEKTKPSMWLLFLFLILTIFTKIENTSYLIYIISVLSYSTGAIILYYFIKSICGKLPQFLIGILTTIGKYSIVVYLIHFFLIPRIPIVESLNATIMIIPSIIISVIIAYICILITKLLTFATPLKYILPE